MQVTTRLKLMFYFAKASNNQFLYTFAKFSITHMSENNVINQEAK